jgi:hypothetical protein
VNGDARGWRIALVPDSLINPPQPVSAMLTDVLQVLESSGLGLLQLPPPGEHRLLLAVIADQIAEYSHHGYAVLAVGIRGQPGDGLHWRRLAALLKRRGVAQPTRHIVRPEADAALEAQRLVKLLASYDLPAEEQRRWRV